MVSIGTISYLGSHGAELLRAGWTESVLEPGLQEWARRVDAFAREVDTSELRRSRVRIEDKGTIVAFHWRGAPDERVAQAAVDELAAKAEADGFTTHRGRKVLEVRPPVRFDKGAGIADFLAGTEIDIALYVGDDRTDLDAFRGLSQLAADGRLSRAVRVGVRSDEGLEELLQEADLIVDGTDGVRELLEALLADV
jgi:trehalose 6-phosphate phosphatase